MKNRLLSLILLTLAGSAFAQAAANTDAEGRPVGTTTPTREQTHACGMKANDQNLKGPERRKFMNSCLKDSSGSSSAAAGASQGTPKASEKQLDADGKMAATTGATRQQIQTCKAEAKDQKLSGAEQRKYVRSCATKAASAK